MHHVVCLVQALKYYRDDVVTRQDVVSHGERSFGSLSARARRPRSFGGRLRKYCRGRRPSAHCLPIFGVVYCPASMYMFEFEWARALQESLLNRRSSLLHRRSSVTPFRPACLYCLAIPYTPLTCPDACSTVYLGGLDLSGDTEPGSDVD